MEFGHTTDSDSGDEHSTSQHDVVPRSAPSSDTAIELDDYKNSEETVVDEYEHSLKFMVLKNRVLICLVVFMLLFALLVLALHRQPRTDTGKPTVPPAPTPDNKQSPLHKGDSVQEVTDSSGNKYSILQTYTRPSLQYTQGFYYTKNGELLESTGLHERSRLQYYKIHDENSTLTFRKTVAINSRYFGEGCDLVADQGNEAIFQLTWLERKISKFNTDLEKLVDYAMPSEMREGWGLTHNPANSKQLIASDSTNVLYLLDWVSDPSQLKVVGQHSIKKPDGSLVYSINEMEWAGDYIIANVYLSTYIVFIDLASNSVVRTIDMSVLVTKAQEEARKRGDYLDSSHCLNGIAFNPATSDFYITGKYWPLVFKVKFPEDYLRRPRS